MRNTLLLSVLWAAPALAHPQEEPRLAGVWQSTGPKAVSIRISRHGPQWVFEMRFADQPTQTARYVTGPDVNMNQIHGAPQKCFASWEVGALVVQSVATVGGKDLRMTDRWSLTGDGNTLTFRERHQYGDEAEGEDVIVLARQPDSAWGPEPTPKLAEDVYKNIQIFKGVPASRLPMVMNNFTKWLGVKCDACHVPPDFEKDDKPTKLAARRMVLMVRKIGQDNFGDANPVTCWMCHRGSLKPESLPQ